MNINPVLEIAAAVAHEANRVYCQSIGDNSQQPWDNAEDWQKESARAGVWAILNNPNITPRMQHEKWTAYKVEDRWVYGDVKDAVNKTHPCLVDYDQLPDNQKVKDALFGNVARGVLRAFKLIA